MPEDFGLMAKCFAVTGIAEVILVYGLLGSIIQDEKINEDQINSLFFISILWSLILVILFFLIAPALASFYEDERVTLIIRFISLSFLFSGLGLVPSSLIRKNLFFKKIFMATSISVATSSLVGMLLALYGYGYKALVFQFLTNTILNGILLYGLSNWKPTFSFPLIRINIVREHMKYGLNMMGNNSINYLVRNADDMAIGKFHSDISLGYYSRAYFLMLTPLSLVNQVFNSVLFPAFSAIKNNKEKIKNIFTKAQKLVIIIFYPVIFFFYYNTSPIIEYIFGAKWVAMTHVVRIFVPLLLIQLLTSTISSIYMTFNKVNVLLRINLIFGLVLIIAIFVSSLYDISAVALSVVILAGANSLYIYVKGLKYINNEFPQILLLETSPVLIPVGIYVVIELIIEQSLFLQDLNLKFWISLISLGLLYLYLFFNNKNILFLFKELWRKK